MTHPLVMTPPYSVQILMVKTFVNCPETTKFAKVFTREGFPLYGRHGIFVCNIALSYGKGWKAKAR